MGGSEYTQTVRGWGRSLMQKEHVSKMLDVGKGRHEHREQQMCPEECTAKYNLETVTQAFLSLRFLWHSSSKLVVFIALDRKQSTLKRRQH